MTPKHQRFVHLCHCFITPPNQAVPATARWLVPEQLVRHNIVEMLAGNYWDEDTLRATSMLLRRHESEEYQEMRKQLMGMDLAELNTTVLDAIKEEQPDVELPSGGKEETVAWVVEWAKAYKAEAYKAEQAEKQAEPMPTIQLSPLPSLSTAHT